MEKVLIRIFSAALVLVCVVGLVFGGVNIKSILEAKDFWEGVKAEALENFDAADAGIAQLKENETKYVEGVETADQGKRALNEGGAQLAVNQPLFQESEAALAAGHATYEQKYAEYQAGLQQLEQGRATLAAGEKMLADNKQAYDEGKATLARVQPLYNICIDHKNRYEAKLAEYNAALEAGETAKANAIKIQVDILKGLYEAGVEGMTMQDIVAQYEAGLAQIQAYEEGMRQVEQGRADIAAGEAAAADAQKQLEAAKAMLDEKDVLLEEARGQLNDGIARYENGKKALMDGLQQLAVFEGGQAQIAEGLNTIIGTDTYYYENEEPIISSIASRLGENYNFYKLDENGEILVLNEEQAVDLDRASEVVAAGREFLQDSELAVTHECMGRAYASILLILGSLVGLAAGILGLTGKKKAAFFTSAAGAVLAVGGLAVDVIMNPYGYPLSLIAQSTNPELAKIGVCLLLVVTAACAVADFVPAFAKNKGGLQPALAGAAAVGASTETGLEQAVPAETVTAEASAETVKEAAEVSAVSAEETKPEAAVEAAVVSAAVTEPETASVSAAETEKPQHSDRVHETESAALQLARIEVEKAKAEAEKAVALAERAKAELELYRLKMGDRECAQV